VLKHDTFTHICISPRPFGLHCLTMHATKGSIPVLLQLPKCAVLLMSPSLTRPMNENCHECFAHIHNDNKLMLTKAYAPWNFMNFSAHNHAFDLKSLS